MNNYIEHWNKELKHWSIDPIKAFRDSIFSRLYTNSNNPNIKLKPFYLPEPYFGDPYSCSAVMINKNPGGVIEGLQNHRTGTFCASGKAQENYYGFAKQFPYLNQYSNTLGGDWWSERLSWIGRLLDFQMSQSKLLPFVLELCPWHSAKFGNLRLSNEMLTYINDFIIKPSENANKHSTLGIILSSGKLFEKIYNKLGFHHLEYVDQNLHHHLQWPINKAGDNKGKFTTASFSIWESNTGSYFMNFCHGSNYNKIPEFYWAAIEKHLVTSIKSKEFSQPQFREVRIDEKANNPNIPHKSINFIKVKPKTNSTPSDLNNFLKNLIAFFNQDQKISELFANKDLSIKETKTRTSIRITSKHKLDRNPFNSSKTYRDWIDSMRHTGSGYELPLVWIDHNQKGGPLEFVARVVFSKALPIIHSNKHDSQYCKKVSWADIQQASSTDIKTLLSDWVAYFESYFKKAGNTRL